MQKYVDRSSLISSLLIRDGLSGEEDGFGSERNQAEDTRNNPNAKKSSMIPLELNGWF